MGTAYKILTVGPAMIAFVYKTINQPTLNTMIFLLVCCVFLIAIACYKSEPKRKWKEY
jgi:hypothetical protein